MKVAPELIVLDACVIAKWVLEEDDSAIALKIRNDMELKRIALSVPDHSFTEILNTLARKSPNLAFEFFSYLHMTDIVQCRLTIETVSIAVELVKKYPKTTFYDAAYHALALQQKGIFVTADVEYFKTARREGSILLLKNYALGLSEQT